MIYIYGENIIFGVDLKLIEFVGLNSDKVKNKIIAKSKLSVSPILFNGIKSTITVVTTQRLELFGWHKK